MDYYFIFLLITSEQFENLKKNSPNIDHTLSIWCQCHLLVKNNNKAIMSHHKCVYVLKTILLKTISICLYLFCSWSEACCLDF